MVVLTGGLEWLSVALMLAGSHVPPVFMHRSVLAHEGRAAEAENHRARWRYSGHSVRRLWLPFAQRRSLSATACGDSASPASRSWSSELTKETPSAWAEAAQQAS